MSMQNEIGRVFVSSTKTSKRDKFLALLLLAGIGIAILLVG